MRERARLALEEVGIQLDPDARVFELSRTEKSLLAIARAVAVNAEAQQQNGLLAYVGTLLPFLILIGIWIFLMNRMQGGGRGGAMGFGKSKAKLLTKRRFSR